MILRTIEEAVAVLLEEAGKGVLPAERVPLENLNGRFLAQTVIADRPYPPFDRATMDGYACRASDAADSLPIRGTIHAGKASSSPVAGGTCVRIMTGAAVPEGADTVVRLEDAVEENDRVRFTSQPKPGRNIARVGEDARTGDEIVPPGAPLTPAVVAALATTGHRNALVHRQPSILVAATGDELVQPGGPVGPAQIRASNLYALGAYLAGAGAAAETELLPDDPEKIEAAVRRGFEKDVLILTGGVSKGERDYVPGILEKLGVRTLVQGVNMKPGKPVFAGLSPAGTFVFGLPGNPFSVHVTYRIFVEPVLRRMQGAGRRTPLVLPLFDSRQKKDQRGEFFPVAIRDTGRAPVAPGSAAPTDRAGGSHAAEIRINGSGDIRAGLSSDGIAFHPPEKSVLSAGQLVEVHLW